MKWRLYLLTLLICLTGCKKQETSVDSTLKFGNIVILGNSITYAPHNADIGWYGDWGMAATAQDSDYAHILTRYFKGKNPQAVINIRNIASFERDATHYDFDVNLKDLRDLKPDLLILRIGENVPSNTDLQVFEERYTALINYFKAGIPNVIVLSAGSVWGVNVDSVMEKHPPYVLFSGMVDIAGSFSFGIFSDPGVALHPSNKGMRNIANTLWNKIDKFTAADKNRNR
jgi:hypothetical protein